MTTYESQIKSIKRPQEALFHALSDLTHLQKIQNTNPEGREKAAEYLKDMTFDRDAISFSLSGIGRVGFRIVEREPMKTIKLEAEGTPFAAYGWIQLLPVTTDETKMKLTLKADLPMMIKMMLGDKLQTGLDMIADAIGAAMESEATKEDI